MTAPDLMPAELLEKGAAYIEEHGLWQGGYYWQDCFMPPEEVARQGLATCARGSLMVAGGLLWNDTKEAAAALIRHLDFQNIASWNDTPGRTAAEVADAMRSCATSLRDGGQS